MNVQFFLMESGKNSHLPNSMRSAVSVRVQRQKKTESITH